MKKWIALLIVLSSISIAIAADESASKLSADIQSIKKEIVKLNRDLFILEEDLLFPANTQFSVFLSMDIGEYFSLDSVQIKIDDKIVTNGSLRHVSPSH